MCAKKVLIVTSDGGWILQRLAQEIVNTWSNEGLQDLLITVDLGGNIYKNLTFGEYDLIYFMTYSCYRERKSPIQVGYFTHIEEAPGHENTKKVFYDAIMQMDFCIFHGSKYIDDVRYTCGEIKAKALYPGIDANEFCPVLRIGVAGRTYHTKRKGEELIKQVQDLRFVEFYFTGEGWPNAQPIKVPAGKMGDFYRDMDYILVPSLYEAGPMCIPEAIASGVRVISSDVGWSSSFPVLRFKRGNAQSLRLLLTDLYNEKLLYSAVTDELTWAKWGIDHLKIFRNLLFCKSELLLRSSCKSFSVALLSHGSESIDKGGPSIRIPILSNELSFRGLHSKIINTSDLCQSQYDVIHVFNVWPPESAIKSLLFAKRQAKAVVFSPIFLDLRHNSFSQNEWPQLLCSVNSPEEITRSATEVFERRENLSISKCLDSKYITQIKVMVNLSDRIVCLTSTEQSYLEAICELSLEDKATVIPNPLRSTHQHTIDGISDCNSGVQTFKQKYGIHGEYILCVGRIEPRKNQLIVAKALSILRYRQEGDVSLVLIGNDGRIEYVNAIMSQEMHVVKVGYIDNDSPILIQAYRECLAFIQLSFSEGISLAALDAYQFTRNILLADTPANREVFGKDVQYLCQVNLNGLLGYIESLILSSSGCKQLSGLRSSYYKTTWSSHVDSSIDAYSSALSTAHSKCSNLNQNNRISIISLKTCVPPRRYIDLTTLCNNTGTPSGIARVEHLLTSKLLDINNQFDLVAWNGSTHFFESVPRSDFQAGNLKQFIKRNASEDEINSLHADWKISGLLQEDSLYFIFGGAWIRNANYTDYIIEITVKYRLRLVLMIHDLIQYSRKELYGEAAELFISNARAIIPFCTQIISISDATTADIQKFCLEQNIVCPPIFKITQGSDNLSHLISSEPSSSASLETLLSVKKQITEHGYLLCVNAIDVRKNHLLLLSCWDDLNSRLGSKCPSLVLVGKRGWNSDFFLNQLVHHPLYKLKIFLLEGIYDEELNWLYDNALACLNPSLYEGWGMPVAEALLKGKACLVSNISSLKEIAPEHTILLSPFDPLDWSEQIIKLISFPDYLKSWEDYVASDYAPPSWSNAAQKIYSESNASTLRIFNIIEADRQILFKKNNPSSRKYLSGFYPLEKNGAWAKGEHGSIFFNVPTCHELIRLELGYAKFFKDAGVKLYLALNSDIVFDGLPMNIQTVAIPSRYRIHPTVSVRIYLEVDQVASTAILSNSNDKRVLGIKLESLNVSFPNTARVSSSSQNCRQIPSKLLAPNILRVKKSTDPLSFENYISVLYSSLESVVEKKMLSAALRSVELYLGQENLD